MAVNFPDLAHLVTVFGSTLNNLATSAGVNKTSGSLERFILILAFVLFAPFEASI
jgi:hypothetical protein